MPFFSWNVNIRCFWTNNFGLRARRIFLLAFLRLEKRPHFNYACKTHLPKNKMYLPKIQNVSAQSTKCFDRTRLDCHLSDLIHILLDSDHSGRSYLLHMKVILTSTANSTQCPKASDLFYGNKQGMINDTLKQSLRGSFNHLILPYLQW